ncbi:NAD(P)-binding protein [Meredithblackwellia eburnea MCA 4105]
MTSNTIILITGSNSGLGYETIKALLSSSDRKAKPYTIILTSRGADRAEQAAQTLCKDDSLKSALSSGSEIVPLPLDIDDDSTVASLHKVVADKFGRLDILVNNAGINLDYEVAAGKYTVREGFVKAFNTNVASTHLVTHAFMDLLFLSPSPRIVFLSSGIASLGEHTDEKYPVNKPPPAGWPKQPHFSSTTYRTTKTAANMMILEWARVLRNDEKFKISIIDPGWNATNLGGLDAEKIKAMGASDPSVGGGFIASVIEGDRDADIGRMVYKDGVVAW